MGPAAAGNHYLNSVASFSFAAGSAAGRSVSGTVSQKEKYSQKLPRSLSMTLSAWSS